MWYRIAFMMAFDCGWVLKVRDNFVRPLIIFLPSTSKLNDLFKHKA